MLDTSTLVDNIHIVGEQSVARVLRNDTEGNDDAESPQVAPGLDKVGVAGSLGGGAVGLNGLLDLAVLELYSRVVLVTTGMVLGEDCKSLLGLVLVDEESRRLRDPPDAA